ncbi:MAG: hypothetical protein QOD42_1040 [Sphingomonadales bacterium]|jgi:hypothetical protein|nr:hypothetical protein [Sphingomonadales bacterium]
MDRRWICAVAGTAALFAGVPAAARISVDPATGRVTCESSAGHYAQRTVASRATGDQLMGRIRLVTPAPSARWVPAAGFMFNGDNDRSAGVQIAQSPADSSVMLVGLRLPGNRALIQLGSLPADRWITLSASLGAGGLLVVRVGDRVERRRVRLRGAIEPVIHCNSGTFEFELAPGMRLADPPHGQD